MAKKVLLRDWNNDEVLPITRGELVLDSSGKEAFRSNEFLATTSQPGLMSSEDKYKIDNIEGIGNIANDKVKQVNTTTNDVYRLLFSETADDETRTEGARKSANLTFNPSTGVLQTSGLIGNIDGTYVNKLTGYSKATLISDITSEDTLISALGKVELRAEVAYNLIQGAYDGDGTIENLAEILKVLEGISDTETIQAIVGKYLPLSGGTLKGDIILDANKNISGSSYAIAFPNSDGTYNYLLNRNNNISFYKDGGSFNTLIHSGNYADYALPLSGGTITTSSVYGLGISSTASSGESGIMLSNNGEIKGLLLTGADWGVALVNSVRTYNSIGIKDDGTPYFTSFGNGTYTLYHTGNFNPANYLPLSGGTIEVSNVGNFNVYNNSQDLSVIHFYALKNGSKTDVGYLGVTANYEPIYMSSGGARNTLIHSGNYSSYALPLSGGTLNGQGAILTLNGSSDASMQFRVGTILKTSVGYYKNFSFIADENTYARIGVASDGTPQYWSDYTGNTRYTLIHSGNIGSYAPTYNSNGNVLIGTTSNNGAKLQVNGDISSTNLWPIHVISKSLTITSDWTDTGISFNSTNFPHGNGSYILQMDRENTYFYTGYLSVVLNDGAVSVDDVDEIILHGGGFDSASQYYLRTKQDASSKTTKIQIATSGPTHTKTINFKFKRII